MAKRYSSFFFLRSYIALGAAILLIALALDSLLIWLIRPESDSVERYRPSFELLEVLLAGWPNNQSTTDADTSFATPGDNHSPSGTGDPDAIVVAAFSRLASSLDNLVGVPVQLFSSSDFAGQSALLDEFQTGRIVVLFDTEEREILYRRVGQSEYVLALGPIELELDRGDNLETLFIVSYYLLVAVILYLWVRPFYRDLGALRAAASRFGRNDFATRLEVGPKSSILPVAESFNRMAERIQYLVTAHRELTNAVSHELRTPLARFKFSMEMLGKIDEPQRRADYLASMKTDVMELEELIDEMLTYARLSEGNLQLDLMRIDLDHWLQRQISQYAMEPIRIDYHFTAEVVGDGDDTTVQCNPDMLARALHNILRNCLRYASHCISVELELTATQVFLRIGDDGPGIPEDKWESIFEPFARLDTSRDRQSGGYGLGLAIARRILQRHGGSIHVHANGAAGACFVMQWPRQINEKVGAPARLTGAPSRE